VAELGERLGRKVLSHFRYISFQMAEVAMSRQMFAEILSLNGQAAGTPFPSRSGARGSDARRREKEEVCLDGGSTCRHAEPYLALVRTPIGEILASRLPEHPEDVGALRAGCGYFDKNGKGGR
jgi:hypothetical protein